MNYIPHIVNEVFDSQRDFYTEGCTKYVAKIIARPVAQSLASFINSGDEEGTITLTIHLKRNKYGDINITGPGYE